MWAIEVQNPGADSRLVTKKRKLPTIKPHEILIKTQAIGVNRADIFQRQGLYPSPDGASDLLGLEVSGIVEKIGARTSKFKIGDKVCALLEGGGYAEYAVAAESQVLPLPKNLNFIEGASLPEAIFTAYSNIFMYAGMKKGETLLVHGGTSGVGVFAVQLAKAFGITCYATAGNDKKCAFLKKLGCKAAINYKTTDFVSEIKRLTGGNGVDCVLDIVGGDYFARNLKVLAEGGRMICISFLQGSKIEANLAPLVFKNLSIMGSALRGKNIIQKAEITKEIRKKVWPLIKDGSVKPVIDSSFSIKDVEEAHKLMQSSRHIGKIILKCC